MPQLAPPEPDTAEEVEPLTYLEEYDPAWVAEVLALAEQID